MVEQVEQSPSASSCTVQGDKAGLNDLMEVLGGNARLAMPAAMDRDHIAPFLLPLTLGRTFQIGTTASVFHATFPQGHSSIVKAYRQAFDRAGAGAIEMEKVRLEVEAAQTATNLPGKLAPACLATRRSAALIYTLWEQARGESLSTLSHDRQLPPLQSRNAMAQSLISAVERIHAAGLMHMDLKPEHVFIERFPPYRVQLIDWGQARYLDHDPRPDNLTFATLAYTRPERLAGAHASPADDWFAVQKILENCLSITLDFQSV